MKAILQRVKNASVTINDSIHSEIGGGLLVFLGIEKGDNTEKLDWMVKKILALRIFDDTAGKMNKSVIEVNGEILLVSQFTLAADCKKGCRPGFDNAESPMQAQYMYDRFVQELKNTGVSLKTGVFGAMMEIRLCNDGPVTIILEK
jgi:D-tyrosyl-tRNA(Tyr) deacylase